MLNREPAEVLLDSGVGSMVLDLSWAAKLGLRPRHASAAVGITGAAAATTMEGLNVSIGDMILTPPETMAFDLSPLDVATSRPIRALLGRDILAPLLVDIDFENRRIAFQDPSRPAALNGAKLEALPQSKFGRTLSISIEGRPPIEALFDLGSDAPLVISPDYVQTQQLLLGKKTSTTLSVGASGTEEDEVAVMKVIEIGGVPLHDVPVSVPNTWALDTQAVVGIPILSRFRLMTDYGRDRIWMLPNKTAEAQAFQKDRLGMAAMPANNCLRVVHVSPGSPAATAGLKTGDEVVAVNDQIVDAEYLKSRPRQGMKPTGTILHMRLRSGSDVTIKLADYY
jgi:predicted aspartyl protease